jgi:hypothetical protein
MRLTGLRNTCVKIIWGANDRLFRGGWVLLAEFVVIDVSGYPRNEPTVINIGLNC